MRLFVALLMLVALAGCSRTKSLPRDAKPAPAASQGEARKMDESQQTTITPDTVPTGKVLFINREARFVVMNFTVGSVPPINRRLSVYRTGLKVGEVKVTGPQEESNTVADIITGAPEVNDDVRED